MQAARTTAGSLRFYRLRSYGLALATLAALGLAAAHPQDARAATGSKLTLNNGDNVTIDGTGTHGTINNGTSLYSNGTDNGVAVQINGTALFTLAGGTLSAGQYGRGLSATGSGAITVTGGTFSAGQSGIGLYALGSSTVTVTGGTFTGGSFGLDANSGGTIDLFGTGFSYTVNGVTKSIASGALPQGIGSLSGTLLNNTGLTTATFLNYSTLEVNVGTPPATSTVAPEPSSVAAFAFAGLGALGLMLRARKRSVSAV